MLPWLPEGTMVLVDASAHAVPGDVVLVARESGWQLHRLVARRGSNVVTRGDNAHSEDAAVPAGRLAGVAVAAHSPGGWRRLRRLPRAVVVAVWRCGPMLWRMMPAALWRALGTRRSPEESLPMPERFRAQQVGTDLAVMDSATGQVHVLNETAAAIWAMARRGLSPETMVAELTAAFVLPDQSLVYADIEETLLHLRELGLLGSDLPTDSPR
jgi:hypothetical protein